MFYNIYQIRDQHTLHKLADVIHIYVWRGEREILPVCVSVILVYLTKIERKDFTNHIQITISISQYIRMECDADTHDKRKIGNKYIN